MNFSRTNLFYFITSLILFSINPFSAYSYETIPYRETEPGFVISQIIAFRDETAVIHLVKPINDSCIEPRIDLRILHPNGTIDAAKVDFPIPEYNFCRGPSGYYVFCFERSTPKSLYLLYLNSTDIESASYYVLFLTRTGEVIRYV
jgi:hypothetical protein